MQAEPKLSEKLSSTKPVEEREAVVVRFAGDSGDGMQLAGMQFTTESVFAGNDVSTLPDFPAEIRAPAGTPGGVSGFQLCFASREVYTPGDTPDVLIALNPAALKVNLPDLEPGCMIIVDGETFSDASLRKAGLATNPLKDGSLDCFQVFDVPINKLTTSALEGTGLSPKVVSRCKNFFALGLLSWLFQRPIEPTLEWIEKKFRTSPELAEANRKVLEAGWNFGETTELFHSAYEVAPADIAPGRYRNLTGNSALSLGLVAASELCGLPLFLGSYPITPASDVLHELAGYKSFPVYAFQAEDEIAGVGSALGASFAGALAVSTTSGPGLDLKQETIGLAVMAELPLIIVDIQRGGPSTGLPTKAEQADLLAAIFGRHGEAPVVVLAAASPADCFDTAIEAARIALKYMTPVILLSDAFIANGTEPWRIPDPDGLPRLKVNLCRDPKGFLPYRRDEETLARPWAVPGTPGLEHRIGGLEKNGDRGAVSYSPEHHEAMVRIRKEKIDRIAREFPPTEVVGEKSGKLLVVTWGSTKGSALAAVRELRKAGRRVSHVHLRYLNPLPSDLGGILSGFQKVLVPEMNTGQLAMLLRSRYLKDVKSFSKVQGRPFTTRELRAEIEKQLGE